VDVTGRRELESLSVKIMAPRPSVPPPKPPRQPPHPGGTTKCCATGTCDHKKTAAGRENNYIVERYDAVDARGLLYQFGKIR
jgi:hypothetical protein